MPRRKITAGDIARNAVRAKHIKRGQVKAKQVAGKAVTNAKLARDAKPQWAQVEFNGDIVAQSGGISLTFHQTGLYFLDFGTSVRGRPITATVRLSGNGINATPCGGADGQMFFCALPQTNTPSHLLVRTVDAAGNVADRSFYVAVFPR